MVNYPIGEDYEWLAADRCGQVARFTTGGVGPIPQIVLAEPQTVSAALHALYELPRTSEARLLLDLPRPDDFQAIAELGFFGYDWQDVHRATRSRTDLYEAVSVPARPLAASALPGAIVAAVDLVRLAEVTFSAVTDIDIRSIVPCVLAA